MHQAFEIGQKLICGMSNQLIFIFSFNRKDMVVPVKTKSLLSIEREKIHVDSALLFQRLIVVYSLRGTVNSIWIRIEYKTVIV